MRICYVDEAGDTGVLPSATSPVQPVFLVCGVVLSQRSLPDVTHEFLSLKKRFFPGRRPASGLHLDWVLREIKGAELRKPFRERRKKRMRHTLGFLDKLVDLLEQHGGRLIGRVWIKPIGGSLSGRAVSTSSVQGIYEGFQHLLEAESEEGFLIADSRRKPENAKVSHSIFTQKFRAAGDRYGRILEMPAYGHSENHVGLQIADLVCSALLFPMAAYSYCSGHVANLHVSQEFILLKGRYGARLRQLQRRQQVEGKPRWSIDVQDCIARRPGRYLFVHPPQAAK